MAEQPQPLPVPPEFSFQWDSPEQALQFWTADLMHWPHGLSNLGATMDMQPFTRGMNKAAEQLCLPFSKAEFKCIRGYVYNSFVPYSTDPAEVGRRMGQMQERMMEHIPGLLDRWRNEYEPEVRAINDETLKGDYGKLSDADLADLLQTVVDKREREGELHFLAVFPSMAAILFYEGAYTQLFGAPKSEEHLQLLQGFPNKSVEANTAVWQLAMEARRRPQVLDIVRGAPAAAAHAALAESEDGRVFRDAVDEFLDVYGWRGNELDIASPTWKEAPGTAYGMIREFALRDGYDPDEEFKSLVSAREARERLLLDRLSGAGEKVEMFRRVLGAAQQYLPIQEDHNFWIDQQGVSVERVPVLEAARRLVDGGRMAERDDVFLLDFEHILEALRDGSGELHGLVDERRREWEHNQTLTPPAALGTPPPEAENPIVSKILGAPPPESPDPRLINGNAASGGKKTGTARVILTLDDGDRLRSGEILVCPATMPPWTPLFGIASAVVTDHGGVLSHTAIVAREYQIPAVVGTKSGTSLIDDGQTITVDGDAGTVRLERE